jgi:hypothetical protein
MRSSEQRGPSRLQSARLLPPVPDHPVSTIEAEYWTTNWPGAVLGLIPGGLSACSVLRKRLRLPTA